MRKTLMGWALLTGLSACGATKFGPNHSANIYPRAEFIAYVPTFGNDHAEANRKLKAMVARRCGVNDTEAEARLITYGPFSRQRQWAMPAACG